MLPFLTQAWQSWKSARATALLVIVAFAVGIGSATTIYAVVHSLLLKPLPYAHGERWVSVLGASPDDPNAMSSLRFDDVSEYGARMRSFDAFGWMQFEDFNLTAPGQPLYLNGVRVTPPLANSLGVSPKMGRWFQSGTAAEAVISAALWQRLGADPSVLGKPVTLSGHIYTVVGVMPEGFNLPLAGAYGEVRVEVWVPLDPNGSAQNRNNASNFGYARLRPGATAAQADAEIKRLAKEIALRDPGAHQNYSARVDDLHGLITKEVRPTLLVLFAAALLLLLITCANVGGLLLARAVARDRETAVRVALGAGLRQLGYQYLLEGLMVALPGAAAGLLLSVVLVRLTVAYGSAASARVGSIAVDWGVLAFTVAAAFVASGLASLAPLWQAARTLPNDVLSEGVRASAGARSRRLSRAFVVAEVALAFVLLSVSSVLIAEIYSLTRVWPGFDPNHLLTFQLALSPEGIPGKPTQHEYQKRLLEAVQAIPGVTGVGIVNQIPLNGCCFSTAIFQEGASARPSTGERVVFLPVNPDYFRTMGIPLRRGRLLNEHDNDEKLLIAVINQAAVQRYWPDRDPVGAFGHFSNPKGDRFQIAGVVRRCEEQRAGCESDPGGVSERGSRLHEPDQFRGAVGAAGGHAGAGSAARDPERESTAADSRSEDDERDRGGIDGAEGGGSSRDVVTRSGGAADGDLGTYGVVSYSVRQRTVEMGTRMALGALSRDLLGLVMGAGLRMAAYGVAIGGVAAAGAMWLLVSRYHRGTPGVFAFPWRRLRGAGRAGASLFPAWRATCSRRWLRSATSPASMRLGLSRIFDVGARPAGAGRICLPRPMRG